MTESDDNPESFRKALQARLRNVAADRDVSVQDLQLRFLMERLLARLFHEPEPPWILKGEIAMEPRYRPRARTTRTFGRIHLDVGFGDPISDDPEKLVGDELLAFAGIAPARALATPKPQQVAEKLHAYTYRWTDCDNTRVKELVDLVLVIERGELDPAAVVAADHETFARRGTHPPVPDTLDPPPSSWTDALPPMAEQAGLTTTDALTAFGLLTEYWNAQPQ